MDQLVALKTFWDEAPYMDGYKSDYGLLYCALWDSVNRNYWSDTEIEYDRIINKTKIGKRMYLAGRDWLVENSFITLVKGKNDYTKAKYNIVVQNCTSTVPSTTPQHTPQQHLNSTSTVPHLNKTKDNKTKDNNINIDFDVFWDLYGNKADRKKSEAKWISLTDKQRQLAIEDIPKYISSLSDRRYQKNPLTYLNGECWQDEREIPASPTGETKKINSPISKNSFV